MTGASCGTDPVACPAADLGCGIDDVARCTDDVARWAWGAGGGTAGVPWEADDVPCGAGALERWTAGVG
ncbi:hypothetical protein [Streptomyces sp. NBC_00076]|uniref:hypothetical protein n=1 Tax=Streptomyces sp. NBC_00076 TaxID=2975642 RepID=UPI00324C35F7